MMTDTLGSHARFYRSELRNAESAQICKGAGALPYVVLINGRIWGIEKTEERARHYLESILVKSTEIQWGLAQW